MGFFTTIWSWIYHGSGFLVCFYIITCIARSLQRTPMTKLKFIEKAGAKGHSTLGKVSSHVYYKMSKAHEVEYAYSVDGKVHFTTYVVHQPEEEFDTSAEMWPGNGLCLYIPNTVTIYYDEKNPKKTVIRGEVFTSPSFLRWQKTKKKNRYRDIYKDWTMPICL